MLRWLAWGHPAWMVASIALSAAALRAGLVLRRARRGRGTRAPGMRERHLRLAKLAVVLVLLGFVGGPISAVALRDWAPLRTFHGWVGLLAALLFTATLLLGRRLERGDGALRDRHALLGALSLLAAAVAAIAGFALLP